MGSGMQNVFKIWVEHRFFLPLDGHILPELQVPDGQSYLSLPAHHEFRYRA